MVQGFDECLLLNLVGKPHAFVPDASLRAWNSFATRASQLNWGDWKQTRFEIYQIRRHLELLRYEIQCNPSTRQLWNEKSTVHEHGKQAHACEVHTCDRLSYCHRHQSAPAEFGLEQREIFAAADIDSDTLMQIVYFLARSHAILQNLQKLVGQIRGNRSTTRKGLIGYINGANHRRQIVKI